MLNKVRGASDNVRRSPLFVQSLRVAGCACDVVYSGSRLCHRLSGLRLPSRSGNMAGAVLFAVRHTAAEALM